MMLSVCSVPLLKIITCSPSAKEKTHVSLAQASSHGKRLQNLLTVTKKVLSILKQSLSADL